MSGSTEQPGTEPDVAAVDTAALRRFGANYEARTHKQLREMGLSIDGHVTGPGWLCGKAADELDQARAAIAAMQSELSEAREAGRHEGLVALADTLQREVDTHIHENWMFDGDRGCWDTNNEASREWVRDREELIGRIRALASPPATPEDRPNV